MGKRFPNFTVSHETYININNSTMTVNSAVILMCQSCNDGGYLFIITILLPFLHLL